jgi:hypothetical protein
VRPRPTLAPILAVLVVGGAYAFSQLSAGNSSGGVGAQGRHESDPQPTRKSAEGAKKTVPFIESEGPLIRAQMIPLEVATTLLRECDCPQLPTTGPASPEHVTKAWVDPELGKVALVFDNRLTMIFTPDGGTGEGFVVGRQDMIDAGDWVGHFLPLRNTTAAGADIGENQGSRLATLHWIEGADLISMYGEAHTLADLTSIAESFTYCVGCPFRNRSGLDSAD